MIVEEDALPFRNEHRITGMPQVLELGERIKDDGGGGRGRGGGGGQNTEPFSCITFSPTHTV